MKLDKDLNKYYLSLKLYFNSELAVVTNTGSVSAQ